MKFFQTILKRIVSIVIVIMMCFICINTSMEEEEQVQIPIEEFPYYIKSANLYDSVYAYIYDVDIESNRDLYMPARGG